MRLKVAAVAALILVAAAVAVYALRRSRAASVTVAAASPELIAQLRRDVGALCGIGQRNTFVPENLTAARDLIVRELAAAGYTPELQTYPVAQDGVSVSNVIVEIRGATRPDEIVVIGAHYDTVEETPGADDNASGVAALLALARRSAGSHPSRTVRFVAFANEEPPHFQTQDMGSWQYAKRCRDRGETIVAMLSLESLGYYDPAPHSQHYPALLGALYPDRADFIAFVANLRSRRLNADCVRAFRRRTAFPLQTLSAPEAITGVGWSDQWSFWQFGYPAVMVSDTVPFRNPHYHQPTDTPETLDYARMGEVVEGLAGVVEGLTGGGVIPPPN